MRGIILIYTLHLYYFFVQNIRTSLLDRFVFLHLRAKEYLGCDCSLATANNIKKRGNMADWCLGHEYLVKHGQLNSSHY
jgi:hypothetical protein